MKYLKFELTSNSSKKLDLMSSDMIRAIRISGAVKSGPIPFKNKRVIYCYSYTAKTINYLMIVKSLKSVKVEITEMEKEFVS
jgi:ribosomal protein S10